MIKFLLQIVLLFYRYSIETCSTQLKVFCIIFLKDKFLTLDKGIPTFITHSLIFTRIVVLSFHYTLKIFSHLHSVFLFFHHSEYLFTLIEPTCPLFFFSSLNNYPYLYNFIFCIWQIKIRSILFLLLFPFYLVL